VDCEATVNAPNKLSLPVPVKFCTKMPGVPVGVRVALPTKVPEITPALAGSASAKIKLAIHLTWFVFIHAPIQ
jgi:hypothetical protein